MSIIPSKPDRVLTPRAFPQDFVEAAILRNARIPLNRKQTALLLGCSREMIAKIELSALAKIRATLENAL